MRSFGAFVLTTVVLVTGAWLVPRPAFAQSPAGPTSVGIEAGLPLVFGLQATHRVSSRWRLGLGFSRLGGFTAIGAEAGFLFAHDGYGRFVPSVVAGAEQYFLEKNDRHATPLGVHFALGLDYHFDSPVSVGARIGGIKTFGSSGGGNLRVLSVENGYTSGIFNIDVRYHF